MRIVGFIILICITSVACTPNEERLKDFYSIEDVNLPEGLLTEVGGMDFLDDGRLVVCFHRGEVMIYNPATETWELFAEGLHDPLGVHVISQHEILVMQRPELTKLIDEDRDGVTDLYQTVTDDFGMSGNYHEFAFGPALDANGNYYISLNTASNGDGIWDETRGSFNQLGRPGRMYSCVPYRGWVMQVQPDGTTTPWASGFRSPDGIMIDGQGRMFVTDNQGDWLGTSKLYHVEKGNHYGHVSSLIWRKGWYVDPLTLPVDTLDNLRKQAAVLFPHNILANSPTRPLEFPENDRFGPFGGQLLIGEMNFPRIIRVMLEQVQGQWQGACVNFLDSGKLSNGNHRMAFGPEGDLWVGSTAYVWAGHKGLQRITYHGGTPMDIQNINALENGFKLTFTRPVNQEILNDTSHYKVKSYYYKYHRKYGSPRMDEQIEQLQEVVASEDGKHVNLILPNMKTGYVYDITITNVSCQLGVPLKNNHVFYTLNALPG